MRCEFILGTIERKLYKLEHLSSEHRVPLSGSDCDMIDDQQVLKTRVVVHISPQ
jgi:hypothetical protein